MDKNNGLKAAAPLILGTFNNILNFGTTESLTGPIARGDVGTVSNHIHSIIEAFPEKLDFYTMMGHRTLEIAKKSKLKDRSKIEQLTKLLSEVHTE